jgi:hypothetical protein
MAAGIAEKSSMLAPEKRKLPLKVALIIFAFLLSLPLAIALSFNLTRMREALLGCGIPMKFASQRRGGCLEAESSERGYLLTGDRSPFEDCAQIAIPGLISSLWKSASENAAQTETMAQA